MAPAAQGPVPVAPDRSAIVVVDVQNDFCTAEGRADRHGRRRADVRAVIPRISALLDAARAAGVLIVYLQNTTLADGRLTGPAVLLLDEPLGALDLKLRQELQVELRRLHKALGSTFIFVTHDQGEALTMSDRIAVMNEGRIVQVGQPDALYERPASRFVAQFIGHTNLLDGRLVESLGKGRHVVAAAGRHFLCSGEVAPAAGAAVSLSLRYEKLTLQAPGGAAPEGEAALTMCEGTVADRTYMGSVLRFDARISDNLTLTADVANGETVADFPVGAPLRLSWAPQNLRLLQA